VAQPTQRFRRALRAAHGGDSGVILLQVMAFSIILAMITFALVSMSLSEYATANTADRGMRAFYIADAGVERAIAVLRADPNWNDGLGADQNLNNTNTWQPLYDAFQSGGAGNALSQTYPSGGGAGSGTYSIYITRPAAPFNPAHTIWIRVIANAGAATRSIEVLLHRLTPLDFSVYSAQSYTVSNGGGNVTLHGSAYFYQDLGLKAVKTGIYNDRQIQSTDLSPYTNQMYVKGTLDMSTGNSNIGTQSQPMYGVHAGKLNLKNNGTVNLNTLELDNIVPSIPYPNVAGYISSLLTNKTYGNALTPSQTQLVICTGSGPYTAQNVTDITFGTTYFFVPTQANAGCTGAPSISANYMLIWDPSQYVLSLNSAQQSAPVFIPGVVVMNQSVTYQGIGTLVVQSTSGPTGLNTGSGQILASNPASYSNGLNPCNYANPTTMPKTDLLAFIVAGNVNMQGSANTCSQEQDVVVIAGASGTSSFTSTNKVNIYGVVITEQLTTTQNPDFYQMPDILQYIPTPVSTVATYNATMPVVVWRWHELTN
jgi:hypothetical protein